MARRGGLPKRSGSSNSGQRQNATPAAPPRRSSRLQNKGNGKKPAGHAVPTRPAREPLATRQKRKWEPFQDPEHGPEDDPKPSLRRPKRRTASRTNPKHTDEGAIQVLTESNLLSLEHAVAAAGIEQGPGYLPDWVQTTSNAKSAKKRSGEDSASGPLRGRSRRPWSPVSDLALGSSSHTSQQSAMAAARYRFHELTSANLFFADEPLPDDLFDRITDIVDASVSKKRKQELDRLARDFWRECGPVHGKIPRQDDCIEPLHRVLSLMNGHRMLEMPQKAEWRPSLKPVIKSPFPFGGFGRLEPNPDEDGSAGIETPRPDITIGIRTAVLVQELRKQGLYHAAARDLLKNLQERAGYRDDRNQWQPALISEPTQRSLNVRFPFLVVEAKSQATGGTMFVAENQAAVSGACALGMQRRLNKLVLESDEENDSYADRKHPPPRPEDQGNTPLAFSISTQGVLHELWAHYTVATDGDPEVHMMMVGGCVPANLQDICRWLAIVDNVMAWGTGQFLRSVVERLMSLTTSAATAVTAATEKPRVPTGRGRPRS